MNVLENIMQSMRSSGRATFDVICIEAPQKIFTNAAKSKLLCLVPRSPKGNNLEWTIMDKMLSFNCHQRIKKELVFQGLIGPEQDVSLRFFVMWMGGI